MLIVINSLFDGRKITITTTLQVWIWLENSEQEKISTEEWNRLVGMKV